MAIFSPSVYVAQLIYNCLNLDRIGHRHSTIYLKVNAHPMLRQPVIVINYQNIIHKNYVSTLPFFLYHLKLFVSFFVLPLDSILLCLHLHRQVAILLNNSLNVLRQLGTVLDIL